MMTMSDVHAFDEAPVVVVAEAGCAAEIGAAFSRHSRAFRLIVVPSLVAARQAMSEDRPLAIVLQAALVGSDGGSMDLALDDEGGQRCPILALLPAAAGAMDLDALRRHGAWDGVHTVAEVPRAVERAVRDWNHVAERQRAVRALEASAREREMLLKALEQAPMGLAMWRVTTQAIGLLAWNQAAVEMFGVPRWRALCTPLHELLVDHRLADPVDVHTALLAGTFPTTEQRTIVADGRSQVVAWVHTACQTTGEGAVYVVSLAEDVTERVRAQHVLQESEQRLRQLFRHSPEAIIVMDAQGRTESVTEPVTAMLGYTLSDIPNADAWFDKAYPDPDRRRRLQRDWEQEVPRLIAHEGQVVEREEQVADKHGVVHDVEFKFTMFGDRGILSLKDVSEQRRTEAERERLLQSLEVKNRQLQREIGQREQVQAALAASEHHLAITLDSIVDAVISTDAQGRITRLNRMAAALTGWSHDQARGRTLDEVFILADQTPEDLAALPARADGQSIRLLVDRSGVQRMIAGRTAPITTESGQHEGEVVVFRDIGDEHRMAERLREAQKLEAIGILAGGVAHDFNNLLVGIVGFADMLMRNGAKDAKQESYIRAILDAGNRAADLTAQLLAFSRRGKIQAVEIDLHQLIGEVENLLQHSLDRRIAVEHRFTDDRARVIGDPTRLQNALLNLAVNARDALPAGGTITFATEIVALADDEAEECGVAPGAYVEVDVIDNGVGMDPEVVQRVFEPFFTTKGRGKGTGLGLASVQGTAREHSGMVICESASGVGTRMRVLLPAAEKGAATTASSGRMRRLVPGSGAILLVDDEDHVRQLSGEMLRGLGYSVTEARNGREAVELFTERRTSFDAVVMDVVMPEMDGGEALRHMLAIEPDLRAVVCSGFSLERQLAGLIDGGRVQYLQKPFRMAELSQRVADVCRAVT